MAECKKNVRIRCALAKSGLKQKDLARIMGCSEGTVSILLKHELARFEQMRIVELISNASKE